MFLPDGAHYLYMAANFSGQKGVDAIFVGALESKERHDVVETSGNAAYAAPGYLLFYRDRNLLAQPFDLERSGHELDCCERGRRWKNAARRCSKSSVRAHPLIRMTPLSQVASVISLVALRPVRLSPSAKHRWQRAIQYAVLQLRQNRQ